MIISPSAISPYKIPTFQSGGVVPPFSFGNALQFDGVNDFVDFTPVSFTGNFTINFWVNMNQQGSQNYGLFGANSVSDNQSIWIRPNSFIRVRINTGLYNLATTFNANIWYCITITRSGSDVTVFRNGLSLGTQTVNTNTVIFNSLGRGEQTASNSYVYLDGAMDEISFYDNVVFSLTDHENLYNSGNGALASDVIASPTAYWRMNGTSGDSTAIDEQGTYNGTLNNFNTATCWVAH